jgi:Flp pilus assembly protein TadG
MKHALFLVRYRIHHARVGIGSPPERARRRRRGATAMEYVFVISLIIAVVMTGVGYFGQESKASMQTSSDAVEKATTRK